MRSLREHRYVLLLIANLFAAPVTGQPVTDHHNSLEWMVARADVIVKGVVERVDAINPGDPFEVFYEVTVHSVAVLKGHAEGRVRFIIASDESYATLKKSQSEALFFLASSRNDFNRQSRDYYYSRFPVICTAVLDTGDALITAVSFDETGLHRLAGSGAILKRSKQYAVSHQLDVKPARFELREPNLRSYTGSDSIISVPIDEALYLVGKKWSAAGEVRGRVGLEIEDDFAKQMDFDEAKAKFGTRPQVPTKWEQDRSLSIDSLEWMAADSDLIVRGTLQDLVLVQKGDPDNKDNYDATLDIHVAKLKVSERIKGSADDVLTFVVENGGKLSNWRQNKTPVIVFLKDRGIQIKDAPRPLVVRPRDGETTLPIRYAGRGPGSKAIIAFDKDSPKMLSSRLEWNTDPGEMVTIIREYLAQSPAARNGRASEIPSVSFEPSKELLKGSEWQGNQYVRLTFPIDVYLEKAARHWIDSARLDQRLLGVSSLVYFRSDENADALKKLLVDPGKAPRPVVVSLYTQQRVSYPVRWQAYTILNAWGYDIEKPRFDD